MLSLRTAAGCCRRVSRRWSPPLRRGRRSRRGYLRRRSPGRSRWGSSRGSATASGTSRRRRGCSRRQGLDDVEIVNFTTDADINAALAAGQLQAGNIATHTAMNFIAAGLPIKIVALLDVSKTADAIVSDGSVTDIKGLKGKQVAYEEGTTSDILLNYALAQNGMTIDDIVKVPMPAADAGAALIAGQVPVAVTYEPYLTLAMQQNPKVKMIYSAGREPGLISDVFVVREEFLDERRGRSSRCSRPGTRRSRTTRDTTAGARSSPSGGGEARGARDGLRRGRLLLARREQERARRQFHRSRCRR